MISLPAETVKEAALVLVQDGRILAALTERILVVLQLRPSPGRKPPPEVPRLLGVGLRRVLLLPRIGRQIVEDGSPRVPVADQLEAGSQHPEVSDPRGVRHNVTRPVLAEDRREQILALEARMGRQPEEVKDA